MSYFRLRDIKTPPFAYVTNKEDVVHACRACEMPFRELEETLRVEIITVDSEDWESRLRGKPMLADHWLIGDEALAATLDGTFPDMFERVPVEVSSWMTRAPMLLSTPPSETLVERAHTFQPDCFYFKPVNSIALADELLESFPPIRCHVCRREMPELPFDFQPIPDVTGDLKPVVSLKDFHLEGYDYLFHESVAPDLARLFPEMILEPVATEPLYI